MGVFLRVAITFSSFITELLELLIIHASQIINGAPSADLIIIKIINQRILTFLSYLSNTLSTEVLFTNQNLSLSCRSIILLNVYLHLLV